MKRNNTFMSRPPSQVKRKYAKTLYFKLYFSKEHCALSRTEHGIFIDFNTLFAYINNNLYYQSKHWFEVYMTILLK